jgi:hypothetical protein
VVANTRGSTFSLCRRSRWDASLHRYPRLPVLTCHGHQRPVTAAGGPATFTRDG